MTENPLLIAAINLTIVFGVLIVLGIMMTSCPCNRSNEEKITCLHNSNAVSRLPFTCSF